MNELKAMVEENKQQLTLFGVIVIALAIILAGILGWKLPAVSVCALVILEAGLAMCLQDIPIWLHGVIVIAQVAIGAIFGKVMFLLVCALFYVVGILALSIWNK